MDGQMTVFLIVLAINLLLVIIYWIWNLLFRKKDNKRSFLIRGIIMILCPVIGIAFFVLSHVLYVLFFSEPVDLEDVIFSKERVRTFVRADEDSERNIVSLEEAIEVTDMSELRKLMMNIVRGDISQSLATISLALNSEDSETAHYAASVLQDVLNEFRTNVQKAYVELQEAEVSSKASYATLLIDYMNQVLAQNVLTDVEQVSYVRMMDEVCETMFELEKTKMTSAQYEAISLRLLGIEDYECCKKWCERAEYYYPDTLATYTCQLKLYFNSGQKEHFFAVIEELKKSAIVIDSETLELIRVFRT